MRDPYDILGVPRTASEADIKKVFRKLAKKHHPDSNRNDPKAQDRFAEVNTAYEILGNAEKRAQFDRGEIDAEGKPRFRGFEGARGDGGPGGFEGFNFGFSSDGPFARRSSSRGGFEAGDIFSEIFGEAFRAAGAGGAGGHDPRRAPKGEDVSATFTITLEDILSDASRRITLPHGREVEVSIPRGVQDGQVVRLKGLGAPSPFGGEPGDALLTVKIAPHDKFTSEGSNLRTRIAVCLEDAVLGGKVRVPTLKGAVEMTIPPMSSSGKAFRLRGKGLPTKDGFGDLYAVVDIQLPEKPDAELEELMRQRRKVKSG